MAIIRPSEVGYLEACVHAMWSQSGEEASSVRVSECGCKSVKACVYRLLEPRLCSLIWFIIEGGTYEQGTTSNAGWQWFNALLFLRRSAPLWGQYYDDGVPILLCSNLLMGDNPPKREDKGPTPACLPKADGLPSVPPVVKAPSLAATSAGPRGGPEAEPSPPLS